VTSVYTNDGYFEINTHTDNQPPPKKLHLKYATNSELAGMRGASIFSFLVQSGLDFNSGRVKSSFWSDRLPFGFSYLGNMATEEEIKKSNRTPELRNKNRRIDFYFHY
tara:strand:+ start:103 stop:426 length:324 start_codon:yes stop_codon:yes gene_type:complete